MSRLSLSPSSPVPSLASSPASSPQSSPLASLPSSPASSLSDDEETCGHDFEFLEDLNEDYKCPVCLMAMNNPVQTKGCGHRCCRKCLLESFNRYYYLFHVSSLWFSCEILFNSASMTKNNNSIHHTRHYWWGKSNVTWFLRGETCSWVCSF